MVARSMLISAMTESSHITVLLNVLIFPESKIVSRNLKYDNNYNESRVPRLLLVPGKSAPTGPAFSDLPIRNKSDSKEDLLYNQTDQFKMSPGMLSELGAWITVWFLRRNFSFREEKNSDLYLKITFREYILGSKELLTHYIIRNRDKVTNPGQIWGWKFMDK